MRQLPLQIITGSLELLRYARINEVQLCLSIKPYLHLTELSASHQPGLTADLDSLVATGSQ